MSFTRSHPKTMKIALAAKRVTTKEVFQVQDKLFHWALEKSSCKIIV
jgi:hypothetical protein